MRTTAQKTRATYAGKTSKAERTRAHILETALDHLSQHGYEGTKMRAVAEAAGLSLGSTYYYFPSKEHLVQAFYARSHQQHLAACESILARETELENRLLGVLRAKFDTSRADHPFAAALFKTAADPASPLSPFSDESEPVRQEATELFARVLEGSSISKKSALMVELPNLLWLFQMGVILFWIHDRSPEQVRSYHLIEHTTKIVCRLIRLASLPPLQPLVRSTLTLLADLRSEDNVPPTLETSHDDIPPSRT